MSVVILKTSAPQTIPDAPFGLSWPTVLVAVALLVCYKSKNFLLRSVIVAVLSVWLFLRGCDMLMSSKWLQPDDRPRPARKSG